MAIRAANLSTLKMQAVMVMTPERGREIRSVGDTKNDTDPIWIMSLIRIPAAALGKSVASARCHLAVLALTMTSISTSNSSSIFQDGKLKPGIYKIQNLHNDAFLDIHEHPARELHLRPAQDLREGRGLVR